MNNIHPWYKVTGAPLHPAILWNDTRTESVLKDILQPELALRDILQPESVLGDRLQKESVLGDRLDTNPSSQKEQRTAGRLNIFKAKKWTF